jgi:ferredoxin
VKITFDRDACQGHNRCHQLAPELFDVDDEGYAILRTSVLGPDGTVPPELEERAVLAADNCPEYAIEVEV